MSGKIAMLTAYRTEPEFVGDLNGDSSDAEPSILGWRTSSWNFSVGRIDLHDVRCLRRRGTSLPAASSAPSGAHRRLSRRKPTGTLSFLIGVCLRDKRMKRLAPPSANIQPLTVFRDLQAVRAAAASLPGTVFDPVLVCHSQTSRLFWLLPSPFNRLPFGTPCKEPSFQEQFKVLRRNFC